MSDQLPPDEQSRPQSSMGQNVTIWILVVLVGVLFGVGPGMAYNILGQGQNQAITGMNYTTADQNRLRKIHFELQRRENPMYMRELNPGDAENILFRAEEASRLGLMPRGETLDNQVRDYLNEEVFGGARKRIDLISEAGNDLPIGDVKWYLQIIFAEQNLSLQQAPEPVVPLTAADEIALVIRQIPVTEAVLSTTAIAADFRDAAAADADAIETAYNDLKTIWFLTDEQRTLTVYWPDAEEIAKVVVLEEGAIQQNYDANKERYRLPLAADAEEGAEPQYKTLADVSGEIEKELRQAKAQELAGQLVSQFQVAATNLITSSGRNIDELDDQSFVDLVASVGLEDPNQVTAAIGLTTMADVVVNKPAGDAKITIPGIGAVRLGDETFNPEFGPKTYVQGFAIDKEMTLFARFGEYAPADAKSLDDVRETVIDYLAAQQAYPALLEQANQLRQEASLHEEGLSGVFTGRAVDDPWARVILSPGNQQSLMEYNVPPADLNQLSSESFFAVALASADKPVRLATVATPEAPTATAGLLDSLPAVRLVQAGDIPAAEQLTIEEQGQYIGYYRSLTANYLRSLQLEELHNQRFQE